MKSAALLSENDLSPPSRDDILRIMANLRQACESDETLERKWMFEMSKYIFHIVGDWHQKVSTSYRELEEKVEHLEHELRSVHLETRERLNNHDLSVNLCLKLTNRVFDVWHKNQGEKDETAGNNGAGTQDFGSES